MMSDHATETLTLSDFLLARIAEDVVAIKAAVDWPWDAGSPDIFEDVIYAPLPDDPCSSRTGHHLGVHPARVLAECEAKRRIVRALEAQRMAAPKIMSNWLDSLLRIPAAVYADHPDYREEWKS